ncbi:sensor histidine kinase regulating citrate/malate metabolism [Orbus hercynius]|uniref:histidine kinase n=1 Tax=Orbus hercynius TaxID=593135 RepID=A0A495RJM2_9GAMM|nr:DcuS/MalK family sensor histidine kinase [Orbus hercynius]RKS87366.1 sensor histidine kinase regulating citrate/malate metabolism [Orbus hercynius]
MKIFFKRLRLKTKLIILICIVFILAVIAENIYIMRIVNNQFHERAIQDVENIANILATTPEIITAIETPTPQNLAFIQQYAQNIQALTQVEFITIFDMNGIRFSHPDKDKIGQMIVGGDGDRVLQGESYISTAQGTLGLSIRAFRPIFAPNHNQIGALMVGQTVNKLAYLASRTNQSILLTLITCLIIAISLAVWFSKSIKNILLGLEPFEMVKLFEERDAIIRTVKEGILVINRYGIITQINDEAIRILRIKENKASIINHDVRQIIPNTRLHEVMLTGESEYDREQNINGIVILTNRTPLFVNGELTGAIASFRDMTEIRQLAENLTGVNRYADALRSQSHEFNNKLHVIYGLAFNQNNQELIDYLEELMGSNEKEYEHISQSIHDPIISGFLTSKFSRARELDVTLRFDIDGQLSPIARSSVTHCLITILGNLIDNGLDAVQFLDDKQIAVQLSITPETFIIEVTDNGHGISADVSDKIFTKGYSTKGNNRGIGLYLVLASVNELNGHIELAPQKVSGTCFRICLPLNTLYQEK